MPRQKLGFTWAADFNILNTREYKSVFYLNSNNNSGVNLLALGELSRLESPTFDSLDVFQKQKKDWLFGYFAYDAKNQLENLKSDNKSTHEIKDIDFVVPEIVIEWFGSKGQVHFYSDVTLKEDIKELLIDLTRSNSETKETTPVSFESRVSKEGYLKKVNELKAEIQYGNIYEINFCQEFFAKQEIDPYLIYKKLNEISPTPYSCFGRLKNFYLMCASPEQYLQKTGNRIISKPIKGTIKRSSEFQEDELLKAKLFNSEKDKSENVMIVDLVRNDFSKCAEKGSVKVDELFGVYSFPQVHQMISTVSARLKDGVSGVSAIKSSFPMGSMTGAPKIKAMELIEKEEVFKRGLYSGSVGYFNPEGDFNFNVVIRSLFYSPELTQLSFAIGGAITDGSNALDEYEESLLKAKAIFEVFN